MYLAFILNDTQRQAVELEFPAPIPLVHCHTHVTVRMSVGDGTPPSRVPARLDVVGRLTTDSHDVLIVAVDGEIERPDGLIYHITNAMKADPGARKFHSNEVIADAIESDGLQSLWNLKTAVTIGDQVMSLVKGLKQHRKRKGPKKDNPNEIVGKFDINDALVAETNFNGRYLRVEVFDRQGERLALKVYDRVPGCGVVEKSFVAPGTSMEALIERYGGSDADQTCGDRKTSNGVPKPM
ncbi:hypothetical protein ACFOY8_14005 [Thalassospira xianhensis]|uniref:Uncharacterized protein n=1 Tax=Thalassospira xianhensis MCCC 1A02616 TaxID=1177929 RepID=A0A367UHD0_9PROT|nr:hypothetical protein [Thalassospira xianhensis]RCK07725.1 hypothetical protein TH5_01265 [Thalassospira xianhensis MCCC 1A02616]